MSKSWISRRDLRRLEQYASVLACLTRDGIKSDDEVRSEVLATLMASVEKQTAERVAMGMDPTLAQIGAETLATAFRRGIDARLAHPYVEPTRENIEAQMAEVERNLRAKS